MAEFKHADGSVEQVVPGGRRHQELERAHQAREAKDLEAAALAAEQDDEQGE